MRISFFGGGTDFPSWYKAHKGKVISSSIDKYGYLTIKKLKTLLMTLFFILIFSHSVFGFVNSKQVMEYFTEENLQQFVKTYINGIGSGIMWSNAILEFDGRKKLFCKPDREIFDFGRWYFEIFAEEFLSNPETYEEMPPAVPLLRGMISSSPCESQN